MEATFCIVDLAGYSALTEAHGDVAAADLAERFAGAVVETLKSDGRLIKSIGDAVLLAVPEPARAVDFAVRLWTRAAHELDFPEVRAGFHHGYAVERGGDVFGAAVNIAARVAAHAAGGQALATRVVADAARARGIAVAPLGPVELRNMRDPVELFALGIGLAAPPRVIDPVCRMRVDPARAAGWLQVGGADYWFCSLDCAARFAESPRHYTGAAPTARGDG